MWTFRWAPALRRAPSVLSRSAAPGRPAVRPGVEPLDERTLPAVFVVTNTDEDGAGSLRQAIVDANHHAGPNRIVFDIERGLSLTKTITVGRRLPSLRQRTVIDGTTQDGWGMSDSGWWEKPVIVLKNGSNSREKNGLTLLADGCTVRGLDIEGFTTAGIAVYSDNNAIVGDLIQHNGAAGVALLDGASHNAVGGRKGQFRNVIANQQDAPGVLLSGFGTEHNTVRGNFIGTDVTGRSQAGNFEGVRVEDGASNNTIGDATAAGRNIISGNREGVYIYGDDSVGNVVEGNFIGTNVTGKFALPNADTGIGVQYAPKTTIGGSAPGSGNVVSGNNGDGIDVNGATGTLIQGNLIGTQRNGTSRLPNAGVGVIFHSDSPSNPARDNLTVGNTIAYNRAAGVAVNNSFDDTISRNGIFANGGPSIYLSEADSNHDMPAPNLTSVGRDANNDFVVQGTIPPRGPSSPSYTVEFFGTSNSAGREGRAFLSSATVIPDGQGGFSATVPAALTDDWQFLTATATATTGDTGPFSNALELQRGGTGGANGR